MRDAVCAARFAREGQRQQLVQESAVDGRPRQVVRDEDRIDAARELVELREMLLVERIRRSKGQSHPVKAHRVVAAHALEGRGRRRRPK
jgi:hypothetical protein